MQRNFAGNARPLADQPLLEQATTRKIRAITLSVIVAVIAIVQSGRDMSNVRNLPMTVGIVILIIAAIASLPEPDQTPADKARHLTLVEMRTLNRSQLLKLSPGMSKEQAMAAMGTQAFYDEDTEFMVPNPYRSETYTAADGTIYELLSYYTDLNKEDYKLSKDEMTPLIFQNGKLVGWGWASVQQLDSRPAAAGTPQGPVADQPVEK